MATIGTQMVREAKADNVPASPKPVVVIVEPSAKEVAAVAKLDATSAEILGYQPDALVAFFTFALTVATILMWAATLKAASAAKQAARVAERALVDLERPFLFVRYGTPGLELRATTKMLDDGGAEVTFVSRYDGALQIQFVNFGRSPAILTEILDSYYRTDAPEAMPNPLNPLEQRGTKLPVGTISANGDPYMIAKRAFWLFGSRKLVEDTLSKEGFFCIGYVRYEDLLGGKYLLGYCGRFDQVLEKFVPEGCEIFNYTRVEKAPNQQKKWGWISNLKRRMGF